MDFSETLISWYEEHKRDLPWRDTKNPYIIWLSEIILQQTRVVQGMPYFYRFVETYPTIKTFASASEEAVLRLWQGLGYYSRARNMLQTARMIMTHHNGVFPSDYESLIQLKGIGKYTAAAISSFSANEARAVVDGNVYRVLSRIFGIDIAINSPEGEKYFYKLANSLLPADKAGVHNQALMEFGAVCCTPKKTNCENCPLLLQCFAFKEKRVDDFPKKEPKIKIKERYFSYLVLLHDDAVFLSQRNTQDIWANMYEFPCIESKELFQHPEEIGKLYNFSITHISIPIVQKLTHQKLNIKYIHIEVPEKMPEGKWVSYQKAQELPKPKIIFEYLEKIYSLLY